MNAFQWAGTALLALELPLLLYMTRARRIDALVALETGATIFVLALLFLTQGFHRPSYAVLSIVGSVLVFAGSMVFVRFMERELEP